jgi:poly(hydroxyalkanoate) depolymerase family esterase
MAMNIHQTIEQALNRAGLDSRSGPLRGVTDTIRQALASAGLGGVAAPRTQAPLKPGADHGAVIDVAARDVTDLRERGPAPAQRDARGTGEFLTRRFGHAAGARDYKLYLPARRAGAASAAPLPLVVMLHGCTQSADDFAAGTQMNRLADTHGFLVVYPEQPAGANPSRCWNWFRAEDQVREGGEPALIAGIVQAVAADHAVDTRRIFVAGLSAGAAMAVILGETHPELFAAVGAHSGLPYRSASDIPSALAAMKGRGLATPPPAGRGVPTIVFHGDRDHTVQQRNGERIVEQARQAHEKQGLQTRTDTGAVPGGRRYTRTVHADAGGRPWVEYWTLHGAGHAWSGGHASGSYTDGTGPDASAEMLRFFLAQQPTP